jgi:hypothetical protein
MPFDNDITTPSSDSDIKNATHNRIKVIDYDGLAKYSDIDQILPNKKSAFILLYEDSPNSGHWTAVGRDIEDNYWFFCSYGSDVDEPLKWTPESVRVQLGSGSKYLSKLFNGREVLYNSTPFQDEHSDEATCGDFASFIINQTLAGHTFEEALENLENLRKPNESYSSAIVKYWSRQR